MHDATAFNLSLLLMRVSLGVVFLAHGINHVFRGGKIAGTGRWFASLGMKPGVVHAWLASLTEITSGALLLVGFLTPLAGAGVVGTMLVAWITNHLKNGFFLSSAKEGYEYVLSIAVLSIALGTLGPGKWSLDKAIFGYDSFIFDPKKALLVTAIVGIGGTAVFLGAFWRPPKKDQTAS